MPHNAILRNGDRGMDLLKCHKVVLIPPKLEFSVLLPLVLTGKASKQSLTFKLTLDTREAGRTWQSYEIKWWSS